MSDHDNRARVERLISYGSNIVGSAAGGVFGFLMGGPVGAGAGAAAGTLLGQMIEVGSEVSCRMLSPREEQRVGAAFTYSVLTIRERLSQGDRPRSDGFFTPDASSRSAAEELLEGVLLKCRDEHQEKKAKFISNIFAHTTFSEISAEDANAVLAIAERLSYRQLCILAAVGRLDEFPNATHFCERSMSRTSMQWRSKPFLQKEIYDTADGLFSGPHFDDKHPSLTQIGQYCFDLMGLSDVPAEDVAAVVRQAEVPPVSRLLSEIAVSREASAD